MTRPKTLSPSFVARVRTPGRYGDGRGGHGLSLLVKVAATGRISRSWSQRLRLRDRVTNIGLGSFPRVTLKEARARALENVRLVDQGQDPFGGGEPTFADAVEKVIEIHRDGWKGSAKTEKQWRATLRDYAMPRLGRMRISEITALHVMGVLVPIWTAKPEMARQVRRRISAICKWGIAQGYRQDDPAGDAISAALPKNGGTRQHQKALPHAEVAGAVAKIRTSGAFVGVRLGLEFVIHTAARSGEVRAARWSEIDLESRLWTIPASRTKMGREHRVPLSDRAVEILHEAQEFSQGSDLIFPSARGGILQDFMLGRLLKAGGIECVPHGFRSSFRSWCADVGVVREVAETALAHVNRDRVEAAYQRSDLFELRRELMGAWSDYLSR